MQKFLENKMIKKLGLRYIESTLNSLPFVTWDRFVDFPEGLEVYGWIEREDAHEDFISIYFFTNGYVEYSTSSAKYSLKICKILFKTEKGHTDCKRVEHYLKVKKSVKLKIYRDEFKRMGKYKYQLVNCGDEGWWENVGLWGVTKKLLSKK